MSFQLTKLEKSMKQTTLLSFSLAILSCLIPLTVKAQVTPDGTTSTDVTQDGDNFTIEAGDRVGDNLFHSFNEFSVPTGGSAVFNNAGDIANIFSRVTGSSISNIDGLLGADGAANLYLINPNGIIFGENASLNLGGSFFASTADSLLFEGDTEFSAVNPQATPLLDVSIPIGASFRNNPGDIVNRSVTNNIGLSVAEGESISLIGGNVTLNNGLITTPGGLVEVGGVGSTETVELEASGSLSFPDNITRADIILDNDSEVSTLPNSDRDSGNISFKGRFILLDNGSTLRVNNSGQGNAGNINLESNNLSILNNSQITTSNDGQGNAGDLTIFASESIEISNAIGLFAQLNQGETGVGGNLTIETQQLSINETGVSTSTSGQGDAGDLTILASDSLEIRGENSIIVSGSVPIEGIEGGSSGNLTIETGRLIVTDNAGITTLSLGSKDAGNINILASESIEVSNGALISSESGLQELGFGVEGNAGNLTIETRNLTISNGSQIRANTFGEGQAGTLTINALESVNLFNVVTDGQTANGLNGLLTQTAGSGNGGELNINTGRLTVQDASQIFTGTLADSQGKGGNLNITASESIEVTGTTSDGQFPSGLVTLTSGQGDAGDLTVDTRLLTVQDGGLLSAQTSAIGRAGMLNIDATDSAEITSAGNLRVSGINGGTAGSLTLSTRDLTIADNGLISVSSIEGQAGNINISVDSLSQNLGLITAETGTSEGDIGANINLEIFDTWRIENESQVSATAFGSADGGNININQNSSDTDFLLLAFPPTGSGGSDIIANAEQGDGGRIDLTAAGIFGIEFREAQTALNDFTVTSEFGTSGETIINRTVEDPTSGLINLPASVGDASDQISQNPCQQGVGSQFIVTGKGGLPPNPTENLESDRITVELVEPLPREEETGRVGEKETREEDIVTARVPAMGWVFNDKGEVTLTAYSNTDAEIERSPQHHTTCQSNLSP